MVLGALGNVFSASHACGFALFNVNGSNGTYIGRQKGAVTEAEGRPGAGKSRRFPTFGSSW
jgi:sporulation-control protein spo0M